MKVLLAAKFPHTDAERMQKQYACQICVYVSYY